MNVVCNLKHLLYRTNKCKLDFFIYIGSNIIDRRETTRGCDRSGQLTIDDSCVMAINYLFN